MHFRIEHVTRYLYPAPVTLGPHTVRLRPRVDGAVHIARYDLRVHPQPAVMTECVDLEGNLVTQLCFEAPAAALAIISSFEGNVRRSNPFDYVITDPDALKLPGPGSVTRGLIGTYARPHCRSPEVTEFAARIAADAQHETLPFLSELATRIASFAQHPRAQGAARAAFDTLRRAEGACRDLAVLFIEACRSQGLPARFVSGYWRGTRAYDQREMHAWAEVYLPGGGWRGYDAVSGLAVADTHVAVAAALAPADAAPVDGSIGEASASPTLTWEIRMQTR